MSHLVRLLGCGYGSVALLAAGLWVAGVVTPAMAGALVWIGGAVASFALAVAVGRSAAFSKPEAAEDDAAFSAALARWEAERLDDAASRPAAAVSNRDVA